MSIRVHRSLAIALALSFALGGSPTARGEEHEAAPALEPQLELAPASFSPRAQARELTRAPAASAYREDEVRAVETEKEAKIRELRESEIKQLRVALGLRNPINRRADLYMRLAELYIEAYRQEFLYEGRVHEARLSRGEKDEIIERSRSLPYLKRAIQANQDIIKLGIEYAKTDQVLFFMGYAYGELGNRKESLKYHNELIAKYPQSRWAGESYRELGDDAYEHLDFRRAVSLYELAAKRAGEDLLPRVLHKLAWAHYRTRNYDAAVETMKQAVAKTNANGEKFLSLREEALRDMAIFMTEGGKAEEALKYFSSNAGDSKFYPKLLEKLGKQYERQAEPAKAITVYESLLKTHPDSEAAYRVQAKLIELDLRRSNWSSALARIEKIGQPKQAADGAKGQSETETQVAAQNLKVMVRKAATENHEAFRRRGNRSSLSVAESFYTSYLTNFLAPRAQGEGEVAAAAKQETAEIRMYLAEVKRDLGKSTESSQLYKQVVDSGDARYARDAAVLWTATLAEAMRKEGKEPKKSASQSGDPKSGSLAPVPVVKAQEPSAAEKEFVEAADRLQTSLSGSPEARESGLKAAQLLAGYAKTKPDALARARRIATEFPQTSQGLTAGRLWLQLQSEGESGATSPDLEKAIAEVNANQALLANDDKNGGKLRAQVATLERNLKVGRIEKQEKAKDFEGAAQGYEEFAAGSKSRPLAEKAFGNAIITHVRAGDFSSIDRVGTEWLKRYPRSPKAIDSLRLAATTLLISGKYDVSASVFEKLGRESGDADALETAGRIHEGNGDHAKAQVAWESYLSIYPQHPKRFGVALQLARSKDIHRQEADAQKYYRMSAEGGGEYQAEALTRLADLLLRSNDVEGAKTLYRQVAGLGAASDARTPAKGEGADKKSGKSVSKRKSKKGTVKSSKSGASGAKGASASSSAAAMSPFVGYARFKLGELMEKEAQFEPLQLPQEQLQKALTQRLDFLEPLSRAYTGALEARGPWAVAAQDRLAAWALNFAEEVDAIAPPSGSDEKAAAQFHKNLKESVADPLRKKALSVWGEVYDRAVAGEWLSPAMPGLVDQLADQRVAMPSRAQGFRGRFRLAGLAADGGAQGRAAAFEHVREKLAKQPRDSGLWVDYGNLLWGEGKPGLARLAYERAGALSPRNIGAINNRGVLLVSGDGEEDWYSANQAAALFRQAASMDKLFVAARINHAALLNYYRLFGRAKPIWEQIVSRSPLADVDEGLAVALQGLGSPLAAASFKRATDKKLGAKRFTLVYNEAARAAAGGAAGSEQCLKHLDELDAKSLQGFEKSSFEHLKGVCERWKAEKS